MITTAGGRMLSLARQHIGERYVFGVVVPKNNGAWRGPWDCAEFASWLVYQVSGKLYGCTSDFAEPSKADAYSGFWTRDARKVGIKIPIEQAARTPGAALIRSPAPNAIGHVVVSDGCGGTIEAHSTKRGVIAASLAARRWDLAVLIPGLDYEEAPPVAVPGPRVRIYRLQNQHMIGPTIGRIQAALKARGFSPGAIDNDFGRFTAAAVRAFQLSEGLNADSEVGPETAAALGVELEAA